MRNRAAVLVTLVWFVGVLCAMEAPAVAQRSTLRFGVIAQQAHEPDRVLRVHGGLVTELGRLLEPRGVDVAPLVIARDLPDLSRLLDRGEVDMVAETAFVTLDLQHGPSALLQTRLAIVRHDQREYHTVFFTTKDAGIKTLEQLRGRILVLQAERSTSAFAVPRAELARHGIPLVPAGQPRAPKNAAYFVLAGAELNQAFWVLYGRGNAGAFNEGDWERLPRKIKDGLVVFHETRPLLRGLVSFRSGLPEATRDAVEQALVRMHETAAGLEAMQRADGISKFDRLTTQDQAGLADWKRALRGVSRP